MKVLEENCIERQVTKLFTIELDSGVQFHISKWARMWEEPFGTNEYDNDWEFETKEERRKYDALPQDLQDEFHDFVNDLEL
jgi:hypothetical protein